MVSLTTARYANFSLGLHVSPDFLCSTVKLTETLFSFSALPAVRHGDDVPPSVCLSRDLELTQLASANNLVVPRYSVLIFQITSLNHCLQWHLREGPVLITRRWLDF